MHERQIRKIDSRIIYFALRLAMFLAHKIHFFECLTVLKRAFVNFHHGSRNHNTAHVFVILKRIFADMRYIPIGWKNENIRAVFNASLIIPQAVILFERKIAYVKFFLHAQGDTDEITCFRAIKKHVCADNRHTAFQRFHHAVLINGRHRFIGRRPFKGQPRERMIPRVCLHFQRNGLPSVYANRSRRLLQRFTARFNHAERKGWHGNERTRLLFHDDHFNFFHLIRVFIGVRNVNDCFPCFQPNDFPVFNVRNRRILRKPNVVRTVRRADIFKHNLMRFVNAKRKIFFPRSKRKACVRRLHRVRLRHIHLV